MSPHNTAFRSKIEREKEVDLQKLYRAIGIPALAGAAAALRPANSQPSTRTVRVAHAD